MTLRETTIAKLQQLPEPLLQKVSELIDAALSKYQATEVQSEEIGQAWAEWFEAVARLETAANPSTTDYQTLLLSKYRQQGLVL